MDRDDGERDGGAWFAPKRYGYGAGLPIAWQGWAVLIVFLLITIGSVFVLLPRHPIACFAIEVIAIAAFLPICARHTRGGWKWRVGETD